MNVKNTFKIFVFCVAVLAGLSAFAKIKIVTTLPNFAFLARQIGGENVEVKSLLGTSFDPHFIDAKPSYVTLLAKADLLISNGLELEVAYLPLLIDQASNAKIRPGQPGSLVLGNFVPVIDVPQVRISRDMGDVHPYGNPHFYLSPDAVTTMAKIIAEHLTTLDASHSEIYQSNLQNFLVKWKSSIQNWEKNFASLGQVRLIAYHKSLNYLVGWLDWNLVDTIEPKPGVPASSSRLSQLIETSQNQSIDVILLESWYPPKDAKFLSEKSGVPYVRIDGLTDDYFQYFDNLLATFKNQLKP